MSWLSFWGGVRLLGNREWHGSHTMQCCHPQTTFNWWQGQCCVHYKMCCKKIKSAMEIGNPVFLYWGEGIQEKTLAFKFCFLNNWSNCVVVAYHRSHYVNYYAKERELNHTHLHTQTDTHAHTHIHQHKPTLTHTHTHTHAHTHIHQHTHTVKHTHNHTHIHQHTPTHQHTHK